MCRILLIRHADHPLAGTTLVGRDDNAVHLSDLGREQAERVADLLAEEPIDCLQSSPRLRCIETAEALATRFDLPVVVEPALDEMDFGAWTGRTFADLESDAKWRAWNVKRSRTRPPGGETIAEARMRILWHLDAVSRRYPGRTIAMVTHAEIVRTIRLQRAGLEPDAWQMIDVPLASVTMLDLQQPRRPGTMFEPAVT